MSCLDEKRKPMVPLKTLDVVFRRRHVPNTQYYFTNRKHAVIEEQDKAKPRKSFRVPRSDKLLSYIKYSDRKEKVVAQQRLSKPLKFKDSLKIAATRDMSKRLFIEDPPDDVKAVVEIHPEFYTVIEGRPLRCFDDVKVYLNNIRCYAMNRQQIGYRRDLVLKIEKDLTEETKEHDEIVDKMRQHVKNFQKFLTEDYKKACLKVAKAEKLHSDLFAKDAEILGYISTLTVLNNIIFKLDAITSVLKMYRRYLLFVAPISWRQNHDETIKNRVQSIQFESGVFMTDNDLVETLDIDKIVESAKIEFKNPLPADLFFTSPQQMLYLFRTMELQSREYLIQLSKTHAPYLQLQDRMKVLKQSTKQEFGYFQYYIDNIEKYTQREKYNETYFREKFFRILNETFYETIASRSTLKLKICIEYVYEQVIGKCEEGHHSLMDPMKILEIMYEEYNLRTDALDFKIVNQARRDIFAQDLKMMKLANKAERELRAFREMTNAMQKAFLPPAKFTRPILKKRISKESLSVISLNKMRADMDAKNTVIYKLSEEEREGLLTFTEWCEGTNPAPYLEQYYQYIVPAFNWIPQESVYTNLPDSN